MAVVFRPQVLIYKHRRYRATPVVLTNCRYWIGDHFIRTDSFGHRLNMDDLPNDSILTEFQPIRDFGSDFHLICDRVHVDQHVPEFSMVDGSNPIIFCKSQLQVSDLQNLPDFIRVI